MGAATMRFMVALLERPARSLTLTVKVFVPESPVAGVPESAPLDPTLSQPGPVSLAKVSWSPKFGSVALVEMLATYGTPGCAGGAVKGLRIKEGALSALTDSAREPTPAS